MPESKATKHTWSPQPKVLLAAGAGGLVAAGIAVLSADPAGRLLLGLAALVLLGAATAGALLRPRLGVDSVGLTVRGLRGTRRVPWPELTQWEVVAHHRLGRRVSVLELTITHAGKETLLLLTSSELGADPCDVLETLQLVRGDRGSA